VIDVSRLRLVRANTSELAAHERWLERLDEQSASGCVWRQSSSGDGSS